ncbi:FprA family A-type flavoprotein [Candidatus Omnitrophota bacterium]
MKPIEIKKDIYWVGGVDWDLREFHGYKTQRGSTYNAYLILDEKITLVDTVKHYLFDEMLERIKAVIDPSKIDLIVSNHVEMDHSGSLPKILELCPNATVITAPNGEKGLRKHFKKDWNFKVVNTGDSVSIGKRTLSFVLTPMLHWPDSMATYIPEEKLLMPNDAFGQHLATTERFDDEFDLNVIMEEAAKYYANIVFPFGAQVKKALEAVSGLDVDMIAPSHGIIWRKHIKEIVELYGKWADNTTEKKAVIIYDTMWGSTEKIAHAILDAFENKGISAALYDIKDNEMSDIMTQVLTAEYICVGSPTLNNGLMPPIAAFLTYMKGLAPKGRKALAFGSYGWGGQSVGIIEKELEGCGFEMMDSIKEQYIPDENVLSDITKKVEGGV